MRQAVAFYGEDGKLMWYSPDAEITLAGIPNNGVAVFNIRDVSRDGGTDDRS